MLTHTYEVAFRRKWITDRYPNEPFRERIADACTMFDWHATPRQIKNKHGVIVMEAAIEIKAMLNGWKGEHRETHKVIPLERVSYPFFERIGRVSTVEHSTYAKGGCE